MGLNLKQRAIAALFSRWRRAPGPFEDGYTILLPSPMDMPFLLRFALEGLRDLDTSSCRQILVIPDGWGDDGGRSLREVVAACGDPRVALIELRPMVRILIHRVLSRQSHRTAANWSHWAMIVEGTASARCEYAFLHDADAFFIDPDALERQYRECRDRGMVTLGVQARVDAFFERIGYTIPGTWEMMFSVPWARRRAPITLKGQWQDSPHGRHEFDTMLYPQYLDAPLGKVGVMAEPGRIVHFHGAVTTYRVLKDCAGRPVVDELFRLLLIAILEDLVPAPDGKRILPPAEDLARGLDDPSAPITFGGARAAREYPIFRQQVEELCESPTFAGSRASRIRELLRPFDEHFAARAAGATPGGEPGATPFDLRRHGLG